MRSTTEANINERSKFMTAALAIGEKNQAGDRDMAVLHGSHHARPEEIGGL